MKKYELNEWEKLDLGNKYEKKINRYLNLKEAKECEYYDCKEDSIKSHTISQKISLKPICEDNHLLYPMLKRVAKSKKEVSFEKISTEEATRFKGFCTKHDNGLFKELDNSEDRKEIFEIILQSYRSICFSMYQEGTVKILEAVGNEVLKQKSIEYIQDLLYGEEINREILEEELDNIIKKVSNEFTKQFEILKSYKSSVEKLMSYGAEIWKTHGEEVWETCGEREYLNSAIVIYKDCEIAILYKRLKFQIPVTLLNNHYMGIGKKETILLFNVIPYKNHTDIYWICEKKYIETFKCKWDKMFPQNKINQYMNIINMIERSMTINEFWYINPKIIEKIPEKRLSIIKNDLFYNVKRTIFDEYDVSIFDDIRKGLLKSENITDDVRHIEEKKMSGNIYRQTEEKMNNEYLKHIENWIQN